jgi:hypothetical protein
MSKESSRWSVLSNVVRSCSVVALSAMLGVGCSSEEEAPGGAGSQAAAVSGEDILNVDDLLVEDTGAGATKVGDIASWLEATRQEAKQANAFARSVLERLKEMAQSNEPARSGQLPSGEPYGLWRAERDGVSYGLMVVKTGENRLRYTLTARKGTERKVLLTGVFLKRGAKRGAGRLHLDLTGMNALTGAPDATGRLHVWFANNNEARARRFRYREVRPKNLGTEQAINHGFDGIHKPGKGGAIRSYIVGDLGARIPDLAELSGVQLAAIRVRWTPEGGRLGAAVFDLKPGNSSRLGEVHECWDGGGLRKAYKSFTGKEDEGDTVDKTLCGGFDLEAPPADAPAEGLTEPEVDAELTEAATISEDEASIAVDPVE